MDRRRWLPLAIGLTLAWGTGPSSARAGAGQIAADETVVAFPALAQPAGEGWSVPAHLWIFEPEEDAIGRRAALAGLAATLGLEAVDAGSEVFVRRGGWFLVDDERGKVLAIRAGGARHELPPSDAAGHTRGTVPLDAADLAQGGSTITLSLPVEPQAADGRSFALAVTVPREPGITVISDIDDTVKITEVTDLQGLARRTFLEEFEAAPGMPELFAGWEAQGLRFVYVSSSPWQLYPELRVFIDRVGLPIHGILLKDFRLKDRSVAQLFADSETTKPAVIAPLIEAHPRERFVLVGDSGEKDPEVYGEMARRFPERVARILIRDVTGEVRDGERLSEAFRDLPDELWELFTDPTSITWHP